MISPFDRFGQDHCISNDLYNCSTNREQGMVATCTSNYPTSWTSDFGAAPNRTFELDCFLEAVDSATGLGTFASHVCFMITKLFDNHRHFYTLLNAQLPPIICVDMQAIYCGVIHPNLATSANLPGGIGRHSRQSDVHRHIETWRRNDLF